MTPPKIDWARKAERDFSPRVPAQVASEKDFLAADLVIVREGNDGYSIVKDREERRPMDFVTERYVLSRLARAPSYIRVLWINKEDEDELQKLRSYF